MQEYKNIYLQQPSINICRIYEHSDINKIISHMESCKFIKASKNRTLNDITSNKLSYTNNRQCVKDSNMKTTLEINKVNELFEKNITNKDKNSININAESIEKATNKESKEHLIKKDLPCCNLNVKRKRGRKKKVVDIDPNFVLSERDSSISLNGSVDKIRQNKKRKKIVSYI